MDWNKEKFDWPHHNLSNFVISDPHTWHIQDTEKITEIKINLQYYCLFMGLVHQHIVGD